ncbi:hypothetical protein IMCC3088_350 [Aequoribacter fuscus]|uniref:Uncharacterized protein n=1 Tax=Aequoribacter fuscus TaxID=2518989 RepID=F3L5S0_9GAMM|nr:hypothetical protein IMCC3088_350 [Aequoribacter fuscus]
MPTSTDLSPSCDFLASGDAAEAIVVADPDLLARGTALGSIAPHAGWRTKTNG